MQYPQSSGQPMTWFKDSPDLRYSTTSARSAFNPAASSGVRSGSAVRGLSAGKERLML
jgi:hypothetical protein